MNLEQPKRHRNERTAVNTRIIEDAVRIAETKAIIAGADEQIEALNQQGRHDIATIQNLIDEVFTQREFYHKAPQEQFPDENFVINKKLREMKNNAPLANIN